MILSTGKYIGDTRVDMSQVIEKYGQERFLKDIVGFESVQIESTKSQVEMAEYAIRDCLSKRPEVNINEIGILIFASNTPCQLSPTVAITLVNRLGMRKEHMLAFDVNGNCGGVLVAINTAQALMQQKQPNTKYALIVGCDKFDYARSEEVVVTHTYGDSAGALLIDNQAFKQYAFTQGNNTNYLKELQLPKTGFNACNGDLTLYAEGNPSIMDVIEVVLPQFHRLLEDRGVTLHDIGTFCWTQGSQKIIETIADQLGVSTNKIPFTGKSIGYSGVTCPIITLDYAIEHDMIKRGELVWFWALGAGISSTMMLLEY